MLITTEKFNLNLPVGMNDIQFRLQNLCKETSYNARRFDGHTESIYIDKSSIQKDLVLRVPSFTMVKVTSDGKGNYLFEFLSSYLALIVVYATILVIVSLMMIYGTIGILSVITMIFLLGLPALYHYFESGWRKHEREELKGILKQLEESFE